MLKGKVETKQVNNYIKYPYKYEYKARGKHGWRGYLNLGEEGCRENKENSISWALKNGSARKTWKKRLSRTETIVWNKVWRCNKGSWCVWGEARSSEWLEVRVLWGRWLKMRPERSDKPSYPGFWRVSRVWKVLDKAIRYSSVSRGMTSSFYFFKLF